MTRAQHDTSWQWSRPGWQALRDRLPSERKAWQIAQRERGGGEGEREREGRERGTDNRSDKVACSMYELTLNVANLAVVAFVAARVFWSFDVVLFLL